MGLESFDESSLDLKSLMYKVREFIKSEDMFQKVDNMHYRFEIVKQEIQNLVRSILNLLPGVALTDFLRSTSLKSS